MSRYAHTAATALMAALAAPLCSGCFDTSREFNSLERQIVTSLEADVQERQAFSLGPLSLGLARGFVSMAENDEDADLAARLIGTVRKFEVGCSQLAPGAALNGIQTLRTIDQSMQKAGLEPIVRHAEPGEVTGIYVEIKGKRLRQMLIVSADDTELTLVRLRGRLDDALTLALQTAEL
jgi:hypothetical protein